MGDEVVTEDGIRLVVEKLDKNRVENYKSMQEKLPAADSLNYDDSQSIFLIVLPVLSVPLLLSEFPSLYYSGKS